MPLQSLPKVGLGTWMLKRTAAKFSTLEGIKLGYRHIDTAALPVRLLASIVWGLHSLILP